MTFRAQVGHSFREFWHGYVYAESQLWTDSHVVGRDGKQYYHGRDVYYERDGRVCAGKVVAIAGDERDGTHVVTILDYSHIGPSGKDVGDVVLVWDSRNQVPASAILRGVLVITDPTLIRAARFCQDSLFCVGAGVTTGGLFEIIPSNL